MTEDEVKALANDPDLQTWNQFVMDHPRTVAKALSVFEIQMREKYGVRSAFSVGLDAIWMSGLVMFILFALMPMIGYIPALAVGAFGCVIAYKALTNTLKMLVDWAANKQLEALDQLEEPGDKNGDRGSSDNDSKTD